MSDAIHTDWTVTIERGGSRSVHYRDRAECERIAANAASLSARVVDGPRVRTAAERRPFSWPA